MNWKIGVEVSEQVLSNLLAFLDEARSLVDGLDFMTHFKYHRDGDSYDATVTVDLEINGSLLVLDKQRDLPSRTGNALQSKETKEEFESRLHRIEDDFARRCLNYKRLKEILGIF